MSVAPQAAPAKDVDDQRSEPVVRWRLVHAQPGSLVYALPAAKGVHPLLRREAGGGWVPADSLGSPTASHGAEHPVLHYAGYIGRVGVLAAALGVGAAVAGTPGVAWAEPADSGSTTSSTTTETSQTAEPSTPTRESGRHGTGHSRRAPVPSQVQSSGGAHTSTPPVGTAPVTETAAVAGPAPSATRPETAPQQSSGSSASATSPASATPTTPTEGRGVGTSRVARPELRAPLPTTPTVATAPVVAGTPAMDTTAPTSPVGPVAEVNTTARIVNAVLTPLASPAAPAAQAAQTPVLWGVLSWLRRTFDNKTPTLAYNPTLNNQVDNTVTGTVNAADADGDTLKVTAGTPVNGGTVTIDNTGRFVYTAPPALAETGGTDTFTVSATDTGTHIHGLSGLLNAITFGLVGTPGHTATTTVTVTVAPLNAAPVVGTPAYTLGGVIHTTGALAGHLNVTDPDDDQLSFTVAGGPTQGTVDLDAVTGAFVYTPTAADRHEAAAENPNPADLADSFTVTVDDAHGHTVDVPVNVTIDPANNAPVMTIKDISNPDEQGTVRVTVTTVDLDEDQITYLVVNNPAHGNVSYNPSLGTFAYTPTDEARHQAAATPGIDTDTFTIQASDAHHGTDTDTATVTISPTNTPPVAVNDSATTAEGAPVVINALANDTDADRDSLIVTASGYSQPDHGSVALNPNGSFTYTPAAGFHGIDTFTYQAYDNHGGTSNLATVTVTVTAVNHPPVANPDTATTDEDTPVDINALANDTDPDNNPLTVKSFTQSTHGGTVTVNNGTFAYSPAANFNGTDTFTYTVTDGTATSNTATVTVTVKPVNDAPVANDDVATTDEDKSVVVDVLANDIDVDQDTLTVELVSQPKNGSVSQTGPGSFTYTPAADFNGNDSFTYTVSDGKTVSNEATVSITITPVNDAPVANDDTAYTEEDSPAYIGVLQNGPGALQNDFDVDQDTLTIADFDTHTTQGGRVTLDPAGYFTYTPAANFHGTDTFTYTITDGSLVSNPATITVTVASVNDAPVAADDTYTVAKGTQLVGNVLANDTDVEGDALTAHLAGGNQSGPRHGQLTLNSDGSFIYTPDENYSGTDSFTYLATDANNADSEWATVHITVVDQAPVANPDSYTTPEDTRLDVPAPGLLANDTDADNPTVILADWTPPAHGSVVAYQDGSFTYVPEANFHGTDSFTYYDADVPEGNTSNVTTVTITVEPVNDAPVAVDDSVVTVQNHPFTGNVLSNDTDVDSTGLTATVATNPSHGTVNLAANGDFTYTPAPNYTGPDSFTYTASDGSLTSTGTVTVTVLPDVPQAPVVRDDAYTVEEDATLTVAAPGVLANDFDVNVGDTLVVHPVLAPSHGSVVLHGDGSFTYTPNANFNGTDTFQYAATDSTNLSTVGTVTITVTPVNDAPVLSTPVVSAADPQTGAVTVTMTVTDPDGDHIDVSYTDPPNGEVSMDFINQQTVTLHYTPNDSARLHAALDPATATDGFAVTANDGQGGQAMAAVNAVPVAPGYFAALATIPVGTPGGGSIPSVIGFTLGEKNTGYVSFISDNQPGVVLAVDLTTNTQVGNAVVVEAPSTMVFSGDRLYVSNWLDNGTVTVINAGSMTIDRLIGVGSRPIDTEISGTQLYVANSGDNTVSVIDLNPDHTDTYNTVIDTVTVGTTPWGLAVGPTGLVYVTNSGDDTVSVINPATNEVVGAPISVGDNPIGVAVNGNKLYVANTLDGTLSVVDTGTGNPVVAPIPVGSFPAAVVVSPDGSLVYVTNQGSNTVTVIDTATNTVIDTNPALPGVQSLNTGTTPQALVVYGDRMAVGNVGDATVSVFEINGNGSPAVGQPAYTLTAADPVDGSLHGQLFLADPNGDPLTLGVIQGTRNGSMVADPATPGAFTYTPELAARIRAGSGGEAVEHLVFTFSDGVNAPVTVRMDIPISPTDLTVSAPRPSGATNAMVVSPDGSKAYLAMDNGNNPGSVVVVDATGTPLGLPITVGIRPSAMTLHGNQLWVTNSGIDGNAGNDTVTVIDTTNNNVLKTITVGNDPRGVAISDTAGMAYVSNWGSNNITIIRTSDLSPVSTLTFAETDHPWGVAASADGGRYVYVANSYGGTISVIDADPSHTATFNSRIKTLTGIASPISLVTSAHDGRNWLYSANVNGGVTVFDTDNNVQDGAEIVLPGGVHPYNVVVSDDGSIVYASVPALPGGTLTNQVYAIDARYHNVLDTDFHVAGVQPLTVGLAPQGMAFNPVTDELYVLNKGENTISVVSMTPTTNVV